MSRVPHHPGLPGSGQGLHRRAHGKVAQASVQRCTLLDTIPLHRTHTFRCARGPARDGWPDGRRRLLSACAAPEVLGSSPASSAARSGWAGSTFSVTAMALARLAIRDCSPTIPTALRRRGAHPAAGGRPEKGGAVEVPASRHRGVGPLPWPLPGRAPGCLLQDSTVQRGGLPTGLSRTLTSAAISRRMVERQREVRGWRGSSRKMCYRRAPD